MSDHVGHECGIALVRLRQPLSYYFQKYETPLWGFDRLFLLMEKQHNRGQDGAGVGAVKLDVPPGRPWMFRERSLETNALEQIFQRLRGRYQELVSAGTMHPEFPATVKEHFEFGAEVLLGHLRYGTSGSVSLASCHPYFRRSAWPTRNLMLAGNFNMTNTGELNEALMAIGQHPIFDTDTQAVLELIGCALDDEHERLYRHYLGYGLPGGEMSRRIRQEFQLLRALRAAAAKWDGGYVLTGLVGTGDAFVMRDPAGIRPAYWLANDEVVAVASERAPLMTVFGVGREEVREVQPGHVLHLTAGGEVRQESFARPVERRSCSFERIYFSRGNDPDIYRERQALGAALAEPALEIVGGDLERAVFSYIPNTAEVAFYGMMSRLHELRRAQVKSRLLDALRHGRLDEELLDELVLRNWPRAEKVAVKDVKLRTFISQEKGRNALASHVYDVCYGTVREGDTLVCLDDSIVRGTTLRRSILRILSRLRPARIVILSTAPQIRYPDCYGIDMSQIGNFIAFEAAVSLLRERGQEEVLREVYYACREILRRPAGAASERNPVARIYEGLSVAQISRRIAELVSPKTDDWEGEVVVAFQSIEGLRASLPDHTGDWYFTGRYPTPGGYRVLCQAYINFHEQRPDQRAYS